MSSSQCARLLEVKKENIENIENIKNIEKEESFQQEYEKRWGKYIDILDEAKQATHAMTDDLQTKISEYESMLLKLVLLKRDLKKDRDQYEARLDHWRELISIGTSFVADTEKEAAIISQDMSNEGLECAQKIFDSNVARWNELERQQKELNKSMKTLEASDHLLTPVEEIPKPVTSEAENDNNVISKSYLQMLSLFSHYAEVPQQMLATLASARSNNPN